MFKIENFGHVLAIAFTLSAIFYYVELRDLALARVKQALDAYEIAQRSADKKVVDAIRQEIYADLKSAPMLSLGKRPKPPNWAELERVTTRAASRSILLDFTRTMISWSHATTHVLAVLSTAVSLGSLVYAGFYPDEKFGWKGITLILVLSFLSIIWSLALYMLVLPKLTGAV